MGFKDRLREKRVEANLTQAALAEKVSVTARTIQNYELGSRKPTKYEVVKKIAEALNTTPEYLLGNSGMLVLAAQEQGGAKGRPCNHQSAFCFIAHVSPLLMLIAPVLSWLPGGAARPGTISAPAARFSPMSARH